MKRDFEVFRSILLAVEDAPPGEEAETLRGRDDYPTILAHLYLVQFTDLLDMFIGPRNDLRRIRLTNEGYDFLEQHREDSAEDFRVAVSPHLD